MVKHTQTVRRLRADELFECVCSFVGLALKGLREFKQINLLLSPWNHQKTCGRSLSGKFDGRFDNTF